MGRRESGGETLSLSLSLQPLPQEVSIYMYIRTPSSSRDAHSRIYIPKWLLRRVNASRCGGGFLIGRTAKKKCSEIMVLLTHNHPAAVFHCFGFRLLSRCVVDRVSVSVFCPRRGYYRAPAWRFVFLRARARRYRLFRCINCLMAHKNL